MPRITLVMTRDDLDKLNSRVRANCDGSQARILKLLIKGYADGRIRFMSGIPSIHEPTELIIEKKEAPKPAYDPLSMNTGEDMTAQQYAAQVKMMNQDGTVFSDASDVAQWNEYVHTTYKCNIPSFLAWMEQHPPDMFGPRAEELKKFLAEVK